jgi:hypothetical protein
MIDQGRRRAGLLAVRGWFLLIGSCLLPLVAVATDEPGTWSSQARRLTPNPKDEDTGTWISPGGQASVVYTDDDVTLRIGRFKTSVGDIASYAASVEASWSPEAQGVFVNASEGVAVGIWSSRVFVTRKNGKVVEVPVRRIVVARRALLTIPCDDHTTQPVATDCLNFASLAWLDHGQKLLVILAVPNSGRYPNMGDSLFFVVDLPKRRIDKMLSNGEALSTYGSYLSPGMIRWLTDNP